MYTALRQSSSRLPAVLAVAAQLLPSGYSSHCQPLPCVQGSQWQAQDAAVSHLHAAGLQPWHVLHMAQPKPKADQQQADNSSQQQEQQQEPPGGQEEGPLEGPNGLLAEWRVESSSWWSKVFRLVVDSSLSYPQFITWAELYQPKPPSKCRSSRKQQQQLRCC